jgi:hypothetical protein
MRPESQSGRWRSAGGAALGAGLAALTLMAIPAAANAATAAVNNGVLSYSAGGGERNALRVGPVNVVTNEMAIEDVVTIDPGSGCRRAATGVACSLANVTTIALSTTDGNDRVDTSRLAERAVDAHVEKLVNLGAGNDSVDSRNGVAEKITAGFGFDAVELDLRDTFPLDAETGRSVPVDDPPPASIVSSRVRVTRGGVALVRMSCPRANPRWCVGGLRLDRISESPDGTIEPRALVGDRAFQIPRGKARRVRVRLSRRLRRQLARDGQWRTRALAAMPGPRGARTTIKVIRLLEP